MKENVSGCFFLNTVYIGYHVRVDELTTGGHRTARHGWHHAETITGACCPAWWISSFFTPGGQRLRVNSRPAV